MKPIQPRRPHLAANVDETLGCSAPTQASGRGSGTVGPGSKPCRCGEQRQRWISPIRRHLLDQAGRPHVAPRPRGFVAVRLRAISAPLTGIPRHAAEPSQCPNPWPQDSLHMISTVSARAWHWYSLRRDLDIGRRTAAQIAPLPSNRRLPAPLLEQDEPLPPVIPLVLADDGSCPKPPKLRARNDRESERRVMNMGWRDLRTRRCPPSSARRTLLRGPVARARGRTS